MNEWADLNKKLCFGYPKDSGCYFMHCRLWIFLIQNLAGVINYWHDTYKTLVYSLILQLQSCVYRESNSNLSFIFDLFVLVLNIAHNADMGGFHVRHVPHDLCDTLPSVQVRDIGILSHLVLLIGLTLQTESI